MISVIIPTYNRANYLKEAIDSALLQTLQDFEIIVVDDASTDNTKEIVAAYGGKIRYLFQENKERAAARNNGIAHSRGEYIAFLDSDDLWLPNHLETCVNALTGRPDVGISFSGSYMIDEAGGIISKMKLTNLHGNALTWIVSRYSSGGCNASSCLVRKEVLNQAGYFNEQRALSGSEDWEMWVRIAALTNFISTNRFTVKVRFHSGKSSIDAYGMDKSMAMALGLVYENAAILPRIKHLRKKAYSSLYTVSAINHYANAHMPLALGYLKKAAATHPFSIVTNKYISYTFLRIFLGAQLSSALRRMKWLLGRKIYNSKTTI